jgi:heavy metal translocating P-type ATPase
MGPLRRTHVENCAECRAEAGMAAARDSAERRRSADTQEKRSPPIEQKELPAGEQDSQIFVAIDEGAGERVFRAELSIGGMTCSACVAAITQAVQALPFVRSIDVSLLTNSASVVVVGEQRAQEVVQTVEDAGFDASLESIEPLEEKLKDKEKAGVNARALWKAEYSIGGMTCSACSNAITAQLEQLPFVESVSISAISNSGTVVFEGQENLARVTEAIEDAGFDAAVDKFEQLGVIEDQAAHEREVFIRVDDMFCHHCPANIHRALADAYNDAITVVQELTLENPIMKIRYTARPPDFTIRQILATISASNPAFTPSIHHPPTIEDRSKALLARERRRTYVRLGLAVSTAVPAFIIGVVCMSIMVKEAAVRRYMMRPMWVGRVSRAEWALFILATPVYFFAASGFHIKALKELRALWRPGSTTPILHRFTRFGSMNMLMSLGTSVAYFSSIAELAMEARQSLKVHVHHHMNGMMDEGEDAIGSHNYFDSVIFLTMFLLLGRSIEAYAKAKTGDAIAALRALRPSEAILVEETDVAGRRLEVDMLEVGDVVLVPNGASPPFDGVVVDGSASFDESSLTGESKLVAKAVGDAVYSGTVNKSGPIQIRLTSISGASMLDQIIKVVREGQTRRAPVERAADLITAHFVPFVVAVGIVTWAIWLGTGLSGALPAAWVEGQDGGWPLWALRFAIAVFVVACPCGIGLAAPTALFVGGGLAAQHGILVKGGGEAFQEASALDCVVFDKTGTLTNGGDPRVVGFENRTTDRDADVLAMVRRLEEASAHPVARALVQFASERETPAEQAPALLTVDEVPGKGMTGRFRVSAADGSPVDVAMLVGNEALLRDYDVPVSDEARKQLRAWAESSHSIVLVAMRAENASDAGADEKKSPAPASPRTPWTLTALFAVADALRPEAAATVAALRARGLDVWMLSGDNPATARAVALAVGIAPDRVIAGVLPDQKAAKIRALQQQAPPRTGRRGFGSWWLRGGSKGGDRAGRTLVAMVGDGINDAPALATADVGIAVGSGSDVALSSASFVLISSDLRAVAALLDLSRAVFRRVLFNFGWALVYNVIAMPVAAGAFYPLMSNGRHVTLDPVWASLAMAMSSVSVICSSLLLRSRWPVVGFRAPAGVGEKA